MRVKVEPLTLAEIDREIAMAEKNIRVLRGKTRMNDKAKVPSLDYWRKKLDQLRAQKEAYGETQGEFVKRWEKEHPGEEGDPCPQR